jgi:spore germination protein KC
MKKILVIIPILFLLTGCYNYRELNDLAIVSAISLSKNKDNFEIVVQIVNPKKEQDTSSSNEPDFVTFKSEGKSLQEAFRLIVKESPKKIYGTQMQLLIIDEDLAKDGIKDILDFFARDPEVRNEFYVLIGQDKDILEILTPLDNVSSQNITESLEANSKYLGYTNIVTYNDLLSNYQSDLVELALPSIKLMGNADNGSEEENIENTKADASVVLGNIGVFKNNKLLGYLSEEESLAYNFITDNVTGTIITNNY